MNPGLIDTNVLITALSGDADAEECMAFLKLLRDGKLSARLDVLVVHEVTYAMPRVLKQFNQRAIADYIQEILKWPGVDADRAAIHDAAEAWGNSKKVSFVDAYLAAKSRLEERVIYTKNIVDFTAQGIHPPDPLPSS